ncbi:MAG: ParA family protein [Deltaproteobacteria bacterium]|nr:ParA family protein [Deltaproteobacteria bacterium]
MSGKIISVINQKGGVGKTTVVANLAYGLAECGKKVLAIDLDPQSNLSAACGYLFSDEVAPSKLEELQTQSIYELLRGTASLKDVCRRIKNFHLVPGSLYLAAADLEFGGIVGRELMLKHALEGNEYEYVLIDCPPNLGLLSLNAMTASSDIIIPVQSEFLALFGVKQLLDTIDKIKRVYNPELKILGVVVTMFDKRKKLSRAVYESIRAYFGDLVFNTLISENVALAEAPSRGLSVFEYAPKSQGTEDFRNLVQEVLNGKEVSVSLRSA